MEAALAHFVRAHPTADKALCVIIVDKDLNEIRVLRSRFPETRILICTFHVVKYFGVAVKKPEYGSISLEDRQSVEHLLRNLVYAPSAEVNYDEELSTVLRFTTHFVAENVAEEYDIARTKAAEYQYVDAGAYLVVKGAKHARDVNTVTWTCPCDFAVAMELPCRHSIAVRLHLRVKPLIPLERIGIRLPFRKFAKYAAAIQFVEDAWMNVRMSKRVKFGLQLVSESSAQSHAAKETPEEHEERDEASDAELVTQPSAGVSLTQNSLYSAEIGDLPIMDTGSIKLTKPISELAMTRLLRNGLNHSST
ncbi:hypothetical protein P43SY_011530 [Pythium insidiosum]|uniref:SWIM-type domain-containing protein n=1 Tax=Pythium insidiosum TaxID=114742 RepID=A0AAD5Q361_PYTIN|nr:hypothetical protein P43SY_011530 [Pythium insidiosum]